MIRYLWSFGNTRIVFKEKSQMKSGGGLLFTAWLLLMAWCLFSNRVSTATVVGNGYLQVVTCKYLIFCSLDKYKLLVPHQVCAFAQKRLIELKSTLNWSQLWWCVVVVVVVVVVGVGGGGGGGWGGGGGGGGGWGGGAPEAWWTLGHAPLNSHRCCPTAVPSLVEQLPCISIQTARIGLKFGGRTPMGLPVPVPAVPPVLTKAYIHARTHFAKKGDFFQWETQILEIKKKG